MIYVELMLMFRLNRSASLTQYDTIMAQYDTVMTQYDTKSYCFKTVSKNCFCK